MRISESATPICKPSKGYLASMTTFERFRMLPPAHRASRFSDASKTDMSIGIFGMKTPGELSTVCSVNKAHIQLQHGFDSRLHAPSMRVTRHARKILSAYSSLQENYICNHQSCVINFNCRGIYHSAA